MEKSIVISATIIAIAIVLSVCIYVMGNRYSIERVGELSAFKVNKLTGETWLLDLDEVHLMKEKKK